MQNKVFYRIRYSDIQEVAESELGRQLTEQEIESIVDKISEKVDWYEPISSVLMETFESEYDG